MKLIDFNACEPSYLGYGGAAGRKEGIFYNKEYWFVKYPDNLKEKDLTNVDISYGSNPISEHIGSRVFDLAGVDVHDTLLGTRNGKLVVACRDFTQYRSWLTEFREYKISFVPHFINSDGDLTNGTGMDLEEALLCIREHGILSTIKSLPRRFWDMFVIDALNGNNDRNNGNWGCINDPLAGGIKLAPVYGNGNSLFPRFSDEQMKLAIANPTRMNELSLAISSRFTKDGRAINPFKYMAASDNPILLLAMQNALQTILPMRVKLVLDDCVEDDFRKEFYYQLYVARLNKLEQVLSLKH